MVLDHILDTDVTIELLRARDTDLMVRARRHDELGVSAVSVFELAYGAIKSENPKHREQLDVLNQVATVLDFDDQAAQHAGEIRRELERRGTPIGAYDLLIAGHARSRGLVLVTRNEREFPRVEGLRVERW